MEHSVDIAHFDRLLQGVNDSGALLLDARNAPDSQRWRPEGPGVAAFANIPYAEFVEDEDAALARVPDAASIYVLCARGQSSQYVTGVLRQRGRNAINVEGGMMAWSAHHRVVQLNAAGDEFGIYQVVRPAKGCLSYIVRSDGQALVVDATRSC